MASTKSWSQPNREFVEGPWRRQLVKDALHQKLFLACRLWFVRSRKKFQLKLFKLWLSQCQEESYKSLKLKDLQQSIEKNLNIFAGPYLASVKKVSPQNGGFIRAIELAPRLLVGKAKPVFCCFFFNWQGLVFFTKKRTG